VIAAHATARRGDPNASSGASIAKVSMQEIIVVAFIKPQASSDAYHRRTLRLGASLA
jgi:hypothetical protein